MDRLISVLRRPQVLVALISEPAPDGAEAPYRERLQPMSAVPEWVCPWREKDFKAYRALARVSRLDRRAGAAIVRTVIGSALDPDAELGELAPPRFVGVPVDLRQHLCSVSGEQMLLDQMQAVLSDVTAEVNFPDWHWNRRREISALPRGFRRYLLWGLHLSPWERVIVTLGIYDRLGLDDHPELLLALARLLNLANRPDGIAWCEVIDSVDPAHRARAAALIADSGAYGFTPNQSVRDLLAAARWTDAHSALSALGAN